MTGGNYGGKRQASETFKRPSMEKKVANHGFNSFKREECLLT
jgi:hypothetical protein